MKKHTSSPILTLGLTGAAGLALMGQTPAATVLTGTNLANNATIPTNHGSNAAGTPNISLTWSADWDAYTSRTSAGYTPFSAWPSDAGANGVYQLDAALNITQTIVFTPDTGFAVVLQSLDLNDWVQGPNGLGGYNVDWSVTGSLSGTLGSGTFVTVDGTNQTYSLGNLTGQDGEALTLGLTQRTGAISYLAMDNLAFDQVAIPEPASAVLGGLALGAMAMRRRRA